MLATLFLDLTIPKTKVMSLTGSSNVSLSPIEINVSPDTAEELQIQFDSLILPTGSRDETSLAQIQLMDSLRAPPSSPRLQAQDLKVASAAVAESSSVNEDNKLNVIVSNNDKNKTSIKYHVVQIGCGVVGGAYAQAYQRAGCKVSGIEANPALVEKYKNEFDIYHIDDSVEPIKDVDFIMISVCTPLDPITLDLDMKYLFNTIGSVGKIITGSPDAIVVVRSTVQPTVTATYKAKLEESLGRKVDVLFQPEFLRAKSALEDALNPWQIVLGADDDVNKRSLAKLIDLYLRFIKDEAKITIMSPIEAELQKMLHNSFNAAKISWFNAAHLLCAEIAKANSSNIDIGIIAQTMVKTCEGLLNPKYGTTAGHAYYGTCLPKDSAALAKLEAKYLKNHQIKMYQSVVDINNTVKASDRQEVLYGDNHMPYTSFA